MKIPARVVKLIGEYPHWLPFRPMHGWESSPDDGGHTHCMGCGHTLYLGDPCVGSYLEFVSIVFCPECVADNPALFRSWVASGRPEKEENGTGTTGR